MKKTLCFVLAAMAMLMLPGKNVQAQGSANGGVNLTVRTIDRAILDSAWLYAAAPGNYFLDSAHLGAGFSGTALPVDSLTTRTVLDITNGYFITGSADTATYSSCFVIALDHNGRYYVLAGGTQFDQGVFQPLNLFLGGDSITNLGFPLTSTDNILLGTPAVVRDADLWEYTNLRTAINWANISMVNGITFIDTVNLANTIKITRGYNVDQNGKPLVISAADSDYVVRIENGSTVNWNGNTTTVTSSAADKTLFEVADSSVFNLAAVTATSAGNVVKLKDAARLVAGNNTFTTNDAASVVIEAGDNSRATIEIANFYGGTTGIDFPEGSHSIVYIQENTVQSRMNGYTQPLKAYGYAGLNDGYRLYARTLRQVADSAAGRNVYLAIDMPAGVKDTIASPVTLQLAGFSIADTLRIENATGPVSVNGGKVEAITCSTDDAVLALGVDSLGYLNPGFHTILVDSGRYVAIDQIAGASVSIRGGKYGERYDSYLAPRHVFQANDDADAAIFPWKVADGYNVTWMNYDCNGNDTTILYNRADNTIRTPLNSPRYPGTDTVFVAWWADSVFTTPWDFLRDTLSGNDTLWAQWHIFNPLTEVSYYVMHNRIGIDALDTIIDTVRCFANIGSIDTVTAIFYANYTPTPETDTIILNPVVADTIVNINYVRDTFMLTWNLTGGAFTDGHPLVERLAWGTTIDYSSVPERRGYTFAAWTNNPTVMPTGNLTVRATWEHTLYILDWEYADSTVDYTSYPIDVVRATFTHDGVTDTALLNFFNHVDGIVYELPLRAGNYTVIARPQDTVFLLGDTVRSFYVSRAGLTVDGFEVEKEKFYDGTDSAVIVTMGTLHGVLGNDEVFLADVHANFTDAAVGENKGVIVYYGVAGVNVANYILDTNAQLMATDGAIIAPFVVDTTAENNGIAVNARGYCVGSDTIRYFLEAGSSVPDEYLLIYSPEAVAQGFDSTATWQALDASNPGVILIDIPANAAAGLYSAKLLFRNSNHSSLVSDTSYIGFVVNLSEAYTMPLFSDVIALVDTCHCFTDIHWFHSTDGGATWTEVVEAQGRYYYQEEGGLTGMYYVSAKVNGVATFTCPQSDMTTLLADDQQSNAKVSVYPNPAAEKATVSITGSNSDVHSLRVMSIVGAEMENVSFTGDSYQLDMRNYVNGSYTVSVDGIVVRVIKK